MSKKKSKKPQRKTMKRSFRLQVAKHWIPKYDGKNIVKGYKKRFNVDLLCAATELEMLGIKVDSKYVEQLKIEEENRRKINEIKKMKKQEKEQFDLYPDSDEYFYFIAGYTDNGISYGITWEEYYLSKFYYIAGYKDNGEPYGITWEDFELSMPNEESNEKPDKSTIKESKTPFDE